MGGAFYRGLSKIFPPGSLFICDRHAEKLKALGAKHCGSDPNKILKDAQTVILAVKPQSFSEFCQNLRVSLSKKLIISIMAGIGISTLRKKLSAAGGQKIVRAMPNLPVQVSLGMTGWIATKNLNSIDKKLVRKIFQSMGKELELKTEKKIDALGAISGCGPAYFFYFTELLALKGQKMGFTNEESKQLAETTFIGSARLLQNNERDAKEWRAAVSSKGGFTERAIQYFADAGLSDIVAGAVETAKKRTEEMGRLFKNV